jgi:hypothetical protein
MSALSLRLPNSLHKQLSEIAKEEGISINQFITLAIAEKLSALLTADYLKKRASHPSRKAFDKILSRVPDIEPDQNDRL